MAVKCTVKYTHTHCVKVHTHTVWCGHSAAGCVLPVWCSVGHCVCWTDAVEERKTQNVTSGVNNHFLSSPCFLSLSPILFSRLLSLFHLLSSFLVPSPLPLSFPFFVSLSCLLLSPLLISSPCFLSFLSLLSCLLSLFLSSLLSSSDLFQLCY